MNIYITEYTEKERKKRKTTEKKTKEKSYRFFIKKRNGDYPMLKKNDLQKKKGEVWLEKVKVGICQNINHKKGMFFARNARARLAAAHHLVEILRDLPSFCFYFQSFSVFFNIDLTPIIFHSYINHSQTDCCLYFLFICLSISSCLFCG